MPHTACPSRSLAVWLVEPALAASLIPTCAASSCNSTASPLVTKMLADGVMAPIREPAKREIDMAVSTVAEASGSVH
jgi:hypothetical protein